MIDSQYLLFFLDALFIYYFKSTVYCCKAAVQAMLLSSFNILGLLNLN